MPGIFPGMDPYLEHPALWPGVHQRLITYMADTLNTLMPAQYVANINERIYLLQSERSIYPDVALLERPPHHSDSAPGPDRTAVSDPPYLTG